MILPITPFEQWVPGTPNHHQVLHWEGKDTACIQNGILAEKPFYFTDNYQSWSSNHMPAGFMTPLLVDVFVFSPLIIYGDGNSHSGHYELNQRRIWQEARERGHDCIIYVPPDRYRDERQGVLLYPDVQINSVLPLQI